MSQPATSFQNNYPTECSYFEKRLDLEFSFEFESRRAPGHLVIRFGRRPERRIEGVHVPAWNHHGGHRAPAPEDEAHAAPPAHDLPFRDALPVHVPDRLPRPTDVKARRRQDDIEDVAAPPPSLGRQGHPLEGHLAGTLGARDGTALGASSALGDEVSLQSGPTPVAADTR